MIIRIEDVSKIETRKQIYLQIIKITWEAYETIILWFYPKCFEWWSGISIKKKEKKKKTSRRFKTLVFLSTKYISTHLYSHYHTDLKYVLVKSAPPPKKKTMERFNPKPRIISNFSPRSLQEIHAQWCKMISKELGEGVSASISDLTLPHIPNSISSSTCTMRIRGHIILHQTSTIPRAYVRRALRDTRFPTYLILYITSKKIP